MAPPPKRAQRQKLKKSEKKYLTKWKLLVYMSKPHKHFYDITATKIELQKYHKIKKQDTKNVTK